MIDILKAMKSGKESLVNICSGRIYREVNGSLVTIKPCGMDMSLLLLDDPIAVPIDGLIKQFSIKGCSISDIALKGEKLVASVMRSKCSLATGKGQALPEDKYDSRVILSCGKDVLTAAIAHCLIATSKNTSDRFECLGIKDGVMFGTDGIKLGMFIFDGAIEDEIKIPIKAAETLKRLLACSESGQVEIYKEIDTNKMKVICDDWSLEFNQTKAPLVNPETVISILGDDTFSFNVDRERILSAFKRVFPAANSASHAVYAIERDTPRGRELALCSQDIELETSGVTIIQVNNIGEIIPPLCVSGQYFNEMISALDSKVVYITTNREGRIVKISGEDERNTYYVAAYRRQLFDEPFLNKIDFEAISTYGMEA